MCSFLYSPTSATLAWLPGHVLPHALSKGLPKLVGPNRGRAITRRLQIRRATHMRSADQVDCSHPATHLSQVNGWLSKGGAVGLMMLWGESLGVWSGAVSGVVRDGKWMLRERRGVSGIPLMIAYVCASTLPHDVPAGPERLNGRGVEREIKERGRAFRQLRPPSSRSPRPSCPPSQRQSRH